MISIVIVNWNSGGFLERCVLSLLQHARGCEILVVDNASEDRSADFLTSDVTPVKLIGQSANAGFAASANLGWRGSRGDLVLFLNPDTEVLPGSVDLLAEQLTLEAGIWAAAGLLLDPTGRPQTGFNVRAFPILGSVAADLLLLDEIWPANPWTRRYLMSSWNPHGASDVYQPAAACLMVSRRALEFLGGFDERFRPAWFEDVDLCRRIWSADGRIRFEPSARFIHHGGYSLSKLGQEEFLIFFHTNQIRYFAKHHGDSAAERVRKLVVSGMYLRAALSLIRRPSNGSSRATAARTFWTVARHFSTLGEVP
ncbi:MAG TPA: glycosyltransferase family 2 protein [Acidobacteriota bacterium]|nr:glycosyltransferase family 2 protein [Acidobacteriota bacterium]